GALREVALPEQRLQRRANATAIRAGEVAAQDGLVDLARAAGRPRQQLAVEFACRAVAIDDPIAGHRHGPGPVGGGDRPIDAAMAIPSLLGPLVSVGAQSRRELFPQSDVQGLPNLSAEMGFDVLTKLQNGGGACARLLHGVPPSPLVTAIG